KLNQKISIRIAGSYNEHFSYVSEGKVDIAFVGPSLYVLLTKNKKFPILARMEIDNIPTFHGHIVTSKSSGIKSINELKNKRFVFGSKKSTMSFIVPAYILNSKGITKNNLKSYRFVAGHENIALSILSGTSDAGAVKDEIYQKYRDQGLVSLTKTPEISEHLFLASQTLSKNQAAEIKNILINLKNTPDGLKILNTIKQNCTGLVEADDSNYNNLRNIMKTRGDF
ncbi:MAG: PhnD/SsuA/transferrin family substrate-binding protein, partial [Spirochaetia bacterium]|nr:PhnD/SsuA/transferrin family substrate-binding protein [Spirochaetia bacterium]